ncbi:TRAP transporter small permease [Methylobacterium sp. WL30]|jgi:C4-dicarboxylate transporter DctQ subunit|uniref:TRAP transporter small permease n=1 Tax=unclassified Methylobacterium TaxID=2615210 RepID=UPI0011CA9F0A|nr:MULTISPECIES: TRAP transporter small permease [unclassified Methylobacterium]TXM95426.1 TRAP transporter small permease [Methylobacterium sp. WL116]TXN41821.1 TRAP transporter small permease [Methylobacterium sp. WL93]TXN51866.1 TRAP transporter small permease [Methylobacterium sp. WL119]TXN68871.1 TRAP transporter small permease [Methylobacterium sp. WL30]TXN73677.1 TRAP transporter small permease [Methylobacterium sp. WL6]
MMLKILDRLEEVLIGSLMAAATLITFAAVVHRFLSGVPALQPYTERLDFGWAQELCIYMFIWVAKFGAAYGVRTGIHVGVDVLVNKLPPRARKGMVLTSLLCGALFTAIVGTLGTNFVWRIAHTDQTTPDMEIPVWLVYLAIPLGSYLMCFRFLQVAWHYLRTGHLPARDHAHVDGVETVEGVDPVQMGKLGGPA